MKNKLFYLLLLFILLLPIPSLGEECDLDLIWIKDIGLEELAGSAKEVSEASIEDKNIVLDLAMAKVGDNAKYEVEIQNDSDEDYELSDNSITSNSEYITYSFESTDESNIIKANSSKKVYLKVSYSKEVPEEAYTSNIYKENKTMVVNLSSNNEEATQPEEVDTKEEDPVEEEPTKEVIKVPDTWQVSYSIVMIILAIIMIIIHEYYKKERINISLFLIIASLLLVPISVEAICKCELSIESNVKIVKELTACIYINDTPCGPERYSVSTKGTFTYTSDMKTGDFINAVLTKLYGGPENYYDDVLYIPKEVEECEQSLTTRFENSEIDYAEYHIMLRSCEIDAGVLNERDSDYEEQYEAYLETEVKTSSEGCYDASVFHLC